MTMQDMIKVSPNAALLMIPGRNSSNSKAVKSQKVIMPPLLRVYLSTS
jgi:hypothetical protein